MPISCTNAISSQAIKIKCAVRVGVGGADFELVRRQASVPVTVQELGVRVEKLLPGAGLQVMRMVMRSKNPVRVSWKKRTGCAMSTGPGVAVGLLAPVAPDAGTGRGAVGQ